jgi:RNA polymerase sigma-70 factor (family 1)
MSQIEPNQSSDTLLLQQVEQGNTRAFDVLFEKYWQQAYSDAYKRLKNHDNAKDIVQEIFTYIWINREAIHIENLPAYLNVAIRNKVIKLIAKQKITHPFFDFLENISKESSRADSDLLWKEFSKSYESLLQTLPPKRQKIFRLRYHEDLRTKDIAEQLGITRKTVQNQLGKAVETLKISLLRILSMVVVFNYL